MLGAGGSAFPTKAQQSARPLPISATGVATRTGAAGQTRRSRSLRVPRITQRTARTRNARIHHRQATDRPAADRQRPDSRAHEPTSLGQRTHAHHGTDDEPDHAHDTRLRPPQRPRLLGARSIDVLAAPARRRRRSSGRRPRPDRGPWTHARRLRSWRVVLEKALVLDCGLFRTASRAGVWNDMLLRNRCSRSAPACDEGPSRPLHPVRPHRSQSRALPRSPRGT